MKKENKRLRFGLITTFIVIFLAVAFVMSAYPYPESLGLRVAYGIIFLALIYGIWAVWILTK